MKITSIGQLQVGDRIEIFSKSESGSQSTVVQQVYRSDGWEEVIFDLPKNHFFITQNLIAGRSWAREVHKIIDKD